MNGSYELLGLGYTIFCVCAVTAQIVYFSIKGLQYVQRVVLRGTVEERRDQQSRDRLATNA